MVLDSSTSTGSFNMLRLKIQQHSLLLVFQTALFSSESRFHGVINPRQNPFENISRRKCYFLLLRLQCIMFQCYAICYYI